MLVPSSLLCARSLAHKPGKGAADFQVDSLHLSEPNQDNPSQSQRLINTSQVCLEACLLDKSRLGQVGD